jgi:uncharacterized protein (DUF2164 family)
MSEPLFGEFTPFLEEIPPRAGPSFNSALHLRPSNTKGNYPSMTHKEPDDSMRIRLDETRRAAICRSLGGFYEDVFDEELSEYRAERLLDFFIEQLGPAVYNQAVQDARVFMQDRLDDLEGEIYRPETPA